MWFASFFRHLPTRTRIRATGTATTMVTPHKRAHTREIHKDLDDRRFYRRWRLALKSSFSANCTRSGLDLGQSHQQHAIVAVVSAQHSRSTSRRRTRQRSGAYAPGRVTTRSMARIARSDSACVDMRTNAQPARSQARMQGINQSGDNPKHDTSRTHTQEEALSNTPLLCMFSFFRINTSLGTPYMEKNRASSGSVMEYGMPPTKSLVGSSGSSPSRSIECF